MTSSGNDEVRIADILATLSARRRGILLGTLLTTVLAATLAFTAKPTYKAEVLISPARESTANTGLSALAGQFGGLAALAGVNLGGSGNRSESVATLASRQLTESYIAEKNLLPVLFDDRWDAQKKSFSPDFRGRIPTLWDGNKLFNKKIRNITEDRKTGLISISIEWTDARQAAEWANDLVARCNRSLRDRAIAESNRKLVYLNHELEKSGTVELRQAIYRLIETEIKNVMVLQGNDEYAFKVLDPAVVPGEKYRPKRILMVALGFLFGLLFSSFWALARGLPPADQNVS